MSPTIIRFIFLSLAALGLVTAFPTAIIKKDASPVTLAAAATTTDPNNVPGPMFCAPECQNIYDVCMGDGEKPEQECQDMSCVSWSWECSECALCK